jgi:hypothetical protein
MKLAKDKVSFKISLAAFQASGGADPPLAEHPQFLTKGIAGEEIITTYRPVTVRFGPKIPKSPD